MAEGIRVADLTDRFGTLVFSEVVMKDYLPKDICKRLSATIDRGEPLDLDLANAVAHAMKTWALERGATHYAHWFQPLSGITSEKHDGFLEPNRDGTAITKFSGKELIQGEPDASSFPNGGLRATFEARGYTAWDATSPAFIKARVLCIPTAFCSYNGEALDKKTPLLRSMKVLDEQAKRVLALFGKTPQRVSPYVGNEQEYFLIKKEAYNARRDLVICGRTLFGAPPCKGQELEEHYFGAIRPTVASFMHELDDELWALGIPAKTEHNEVAPCQHELAPVYTELNEGVDNNLLVMEKMKFVASRHGLVCLLHEKPFKGINGSGKHNNWSVATESENLLDPGDSPLENLQFIVFLTAVIEAVDTYQDLLRTTVATCSNDHRLGADEAPPAIMSIFLGDCLTEVVEKIADGKASIHATHDILDLGADVLPKLEQDNTDRNRTSPFAFTGNKFEFRALGSESNPADTNTVLDTAVAASLKRFADALEDTPRERFAAAVLDLCKIRLNEHRRILFSGDGYCEAWHEEARRRGLSDLRTTADALSCYLDEKNIDLFQSMGVLTAPEMHSRYEVKLEKYNKLMNIEATTMTREARRAYRPVITAYATKVAKGLEAIRSAGADASMKSEQDTLNRLCQGITEINDGIDALVEVHERAEAITDAQEQAMCYAHEVNPAMERLRCAVDAMEEIVAADYWPVPTYDDILFYV
ncbi:glutamine synthetase catalytic region [Coriobacterium glomerans PW2]|uniref:Glutamine synthetase catalytic region n=1 Tax=Coriobacterium glomerans (strain ATCC 49209 / DSM 20642 / JCM 10262 / PW2) TaxID=700015 RepID=F2NAR2_CORGP|nr:glutamine synthetase III [Coriobacterium glomerans]AEB07518.1 glutamine synthetase catalytic region [Coriobacterium glomerans PW2]